jgi:hypothetical protein
MADIDQSIPHDEAHAEARRIVSSFAALDPERFALFARRLRYLQRA